MELLHYFRVLPADASEARNLSRRLEPILHDSFEIRLEYCFNIGLSRALDDEELSSLSWLLAETFARESFGPSSFLKPADGLIFEVGPRLSFSTAWSTNAVAICRNCGLQAVLRIERSRRTQLAGVYEIEEETRRILLGLLHDRMTECLYERPLGSFDHGMKPAPVKSIPLLREGRKALEELNKRLGLAFDHRDLDYYTKLFCEKLRRDPTEVECFDLAQSNSEHSRHWFFSGRLSIDGVEQPKSLMKMVREPLEQKPANSVIAFRDNSSSIRGAQVPALKAGHPGRGGAMKLSDTDFDITLTAETHNFPSGVAPFPGAETGSGGRIRDGHATGRASLIGGGTAGYCVGNLRIPGAELPWEEEEFLYPGGLASPLEIEIEASNGASDYGNKFGEPLIAGFTRSFGLRLPSGERREWIKPIMFSGGLGQMEHRHAEKGSPRPGMLVVKIGGPAYRIGMGGGAASSMLQGENAQDLDFNAVQRGDAEMEQKVNRVIRACSELGDHNPIVSIHDQGAGGNCNVLKEIVEPEGAQIEIREIPIGDESLSVLEIWGAEYQENDALLISEEDATLFGALCERERAPWAIVGRVTGDGRILVHDASDDSFPVNMNLEDILGKMPPKSFELKRMKFRGEALRLPENLDVGTALGRVLRLLSVGSKRFLTTKVDRAVTGLVARQQCVGPLHLPLADVAVMAHSHFSTLGGATAIGEQPTIGLLDPMAMARMSVSEALCNLVWAPITSIGDIRCSANWMWAAKLPGEGAALHDALVAMKEMMIQLGIAVDGGKDSLSMAAMAPLEGGASETVKAPGSLVISAYAPCTDIRRVLTPDLKSPGSSRLLLIDLSPGHLRLGASALAQCFAQIGETPPDLGDPEMLARAFGAIQILIAEEKILAGHDRSDGGLIVCALEMAFSGNCGLELDLDSEGKGAMALLFAEEGGLLIEVSEDESAGICSRLESEGLSCREIGRSRPDQQIEIRVDGSRVLKEKMSRLRDTWERSSFALEKLQAAPELVKKEQDGLRKRKTPAWRLNFRTMAPSARHRHPPRVAILREEGSNSDREMAAAFHMAGFEAWDITMSDLREGKLSLGDFRGLAAVGGFSYADVLDSAKGWAGVIRQNESLAAQFNTFYQRPDTFSLGVCNGCQLMALLGWVPFRGLPDREQPRFIHNASGRFESRFVSVRIEKSPSIMLRGMEDSVLGIWIQHGEGRAHFPKTAVLEDVLDRHLAPLRYADDSGHPTEEYPFNPNSSPEGIAALCSADGRHLALMPHPERTFLPWQWPWMPRSWKAMEFSPWLQLFLNARKWCGEA